MPTVSLLMKQSPYLTELALFDVVPVVVGVAVDLSHINTPSVVKGYTKDNDGLAQALKGCDIVVIPAGVPRKPGMTRCERHLKQVALIADRLYCLPSAEMISSASMQASAPTSPTGSLRTARMPLYVLSRTPSTRPYRSSQRLSRRQAPSIRRSECWQLARLNALLIATRLFGVSTLDIVRASTFVTELLNIPQESSKYAIPVVGGHSGATIVPLLSQSQPKIDEKLLGDKEKVDKLINRIQFGGDEVVKAKDGAGSATVGQRPLWKGTS